MFVLAVRVCRKCCEKSAELLGAVEALYFAVPDVENGSLFECGRPSSSLSERSDQGRLDLVGSR